MATNPQEYKESDMSAEEWKEYTEAKAMLIRDRDKILKEASILADKVKAHPRQRGNGS